MLCLGVGSGLAAGTSCRIQQPFHGGDLALHSLRPRFDHPPCRLCFSIHVTIFDKVRPILLYFYTFNTSIFQYSYTSSTSILSIFFSKKGRTKNNVNHPMQASQLALDRRVLKEESWGWQTHNFIHLISQAPWLEPTGWLAGWLTD